MISNLKNWLRDILSNKYSIGTKLIVSFLCISLIPIMVMQIVNFYYVRAVTEKKIEELTDANLKQTIGTLQAELKAYEDLAFQIITDDAIIDLVKKLNNQDISARVAPLSNLISKINTLSYSKKGITSITIMAENGEIAYYDKKLDDYSRSIWSEHSDLNVKSIYEQIIRAPWKTVWGGTKYVGNRGGENGFMFTLGRKIIDLPVNKPVGAVIIGIDESVLSNICNNAVNNEGTYKNFSFMIDNEGTIISFSDKSHIGSGIERIINREDINKVLGLTSGSTSFTSSLGRNKMLINSMDIPNTGWKLVNVISRDYLFKEISVFQNVIIVIGIILSIFAILSVTIVSKGISRSVRRVVKAMKEAESGELSVKVNLNTRDEITIIGSSFNRMIAKIRDLMDELRRQMELVQEATTKEKEAEIQALEAQINPHFLYNTLDTINWMAIEKEEYDISNMLKQLATILRYSIDRSNSVVTVREEVEWLKKYLFIQQSRFSNSFDYSIEIEETMMDYKIHKLLLQAIIENSIIHGFENIDYGGLIKIKGELIGKDKLQITISDNGKGMDGQKLKSVFREFDNENSSYRRIGVQNVIRRLKMYYDCNGYIQAESQEGKGTVVRVIVPKMI